MRDVLVYLDGSLGFVLDVNRNVLHMCLMIDSTARKHRFAKARAKCTKAA